MMKTMTFHEFQVKWRAIPERQNSYLSLGNVHPLDLQIGYGSNNFKSLVVMNAGVVKDIPSSFAVQVENPELTNGTRVLEFQLIHNSFEEEFQRLCWDMIEVTIESLHPLNDMIARYMTWQRLLQYYSPGIMSFERQKGLLGELLYFQEIVSHFGIHYAINAWCGPDGCDQDYLFETYWAEVKTTALASESVRISSLEQFEQEQDGLLIIYVLEKSTPGENRISLPDVVSEIRRSVAADSVAADKFEMKLFKYGYRSNDEDKYQKNWFRLIEKREYIVDERFPKLTRKNVPAGLSACRYELSLQALESYRRK